MRIGSDMRGLRLYSPDLVMRARPTREDDGANAASEARKAAVREMIPEDRSPGDISAQERQVLAREQALKSRVPGGSAHTTYTYAVGPDGKRYIVGAEVRVVAPEDELEAATGGTGRPAGTKLSAKPAADEAETPEEKAKTAEQDPETAAQIAKLQQTEREVIAHEAAHMAVGGQFAGGASYSYTTGPDGKRYVTGGEVPISTPETDDPDEALRNAEQVMRAAMAPANPSGQDIAVAAGAAQTAAQARAQIATQNDGEAAGTSGKTAESEATPIDSYKGEQAKRAYASTESPKGLWTESGGYAPRTAQDEDEPVRDSLRARELEGIAA